MRRLVRKLEAVREVEMHGPILERHLRETEPAELVAELVWILRNAHRGAVELVYSSLTDYMLHDDGPPYHVKEDLYRAAREDGADGVALLLLEPLPRKSTSKRWTGDVDPPLMERTLGERKSMARQPNRELLQKLLRATEVDVVRILLRNRRLTEPDVVWLAARRPNAAPVLREVARSRKWRASARVRLSLVQNPYTPPRIAVVLAPRLAPPDLKQVAQSNELHPLVREMARYLIADRNPPPPGGPPAVVLPFPAEEGDAGDE